MLTYWRDGSYSNCFYSGVGVVKIRLKTNNAQINGSVGWNHLEILTVLASFICPPLQFVRLQIFCHTQDFYRLEYQQAQKKLVTKGKFIDSVYIRRTKKSHQKKKI